MYSVELRINIFFFYFSENQRDERNFETIFRLVESGRYNRLTLRPRVRYKVLFYRLVNLLAVQMLASFNHLYTLLLSLGFFSRMELFPYRNKYFLNFPT